MMLRSSSTPILGSLLSPYFESPNHNHHHHHHHEDFNSPKHAPKKLSFHHQTRPLNLIAPSSCSFSSSPSINAEYASGDCYKSPMNNFRRVQSDGNLQGLLVSSSFNSFDELHHPILPKTRKLNCSVLETIPSFSSHHLMNIYDDDDDDEEQEEEEEEEGRKLKSHSWERLMKVESEDIGLGKSMTYINNSGYLCDENFHIEEGISKNIPSKMYLAAGLGVVTGGLNGGGGGGNGGQTRYRPTGTGGDGAGMEEYYKKMVEENPGNPLFLRNYAQFLHQCKGDVGGAEEYYGRAILMDPGDGEILSKYAQLTWELHRDQQRASTYFQRALQLAPQDSHVLAAYADFLWETEDDEAEETEMLCPNISLLRQNAVTSAKT